MRCLLLLLVACAPYRSEALFDLSKMEGARRYQCLDLQATPGFGGGASWIPIHFAIGNHCRHAVNVDLSAIRVWASHHGQEEGPLRAYDPREEIHPAQLDGRMRAEETIAYTVPPNWVGKQLHVCVRLRDVAEAVEDPSSYCFDWTTN